MTDAAHPSRLFLTARRVPSRGLAGRLAPHDGSPAYMKALFARKPIADDAMIGDLPIEADHSRKLWRSLGAGDLVTLAIGAEIGAGIFSSIGTAAAGEVLRRNQQSPPPDAR